MRRCRLDHPQTPTDIRKFLGFTGYYRYFVPNYSKIAQPLLDLTKKAMPWLWDPNINEPSKN